MCSSLRWVVVGCFLLGSFVQAGEIGYVEQFALARDRAAALQQLVPGSEDYYYYNCLYLQQTQKFDDVRSLLQPWINRFGRTPRVVEIELRQALLTYDRNPEQSLEALRRHLQLQFNHQRENIGAKPDLPTALDQKLIERDRLTEEALRRFGNLDGFEDAALDWLVARPLDPDRRRILLQRLQRPDYATLPQLIVEDLQHSNSGGFGSLPIHSLLLKSELDQLLKLRPDLLNQQNFLQTYLAKLTPTADVDWRNNVEERQSYLDRLWAFVSQLAPTHNSLKANVLYHRLAHDRQLGVYDKQRFMTYIQLPRRANYVARAMLEGEAMRGFPVDLNANFSNVTGLPPVGNDEPLVREYLAHFFIEENTTKPYEPFINDVYLRHVFAETKIVNKLGDPSEWYSLLPPDRYQALKERIDLDFVPTNREQFKADEPVVIDLFVKNVRTLIVKVFEINTRNYYRQNQKPINTDINLDGLVANYEKTIEYDEPPLSRVRRHFDFPEITKPGVYVIDFIGNGISSRVVVRKGSLRHLVRSTASGHVFTLLDEQNEVVKDGILWLAGQEYAAREDGQIIVPFTDKPGQQTIVLSRKSSPLATFETFEHQSENYSLIAGIHLDRESLISRKTAEVLIRPSLTVNGNPVSLSSLEDVRLTVQSQDLDGVSTTKEVKPFALAEDQESTFKFQTPPRLASITFTLTAKIQSLSENKKVDLSASQTFSLNSIDKSDKVEDLHLALTQAGYFVEVLGRTGEPKADRAVQFEIKHRDFREPVRVTLKSDESGRIMLGKLDDIDSIKATGLEGVARNWRLQRPQYTHRQLLHATAGETIVVPLVAEKLDRSAVSLLEMRGETFVADRFDNLSHESGTLHIKDLAPGDYDLWLKEKNHRIRIRVTAGERRARYALGEFRHLEVREHPPVQILEAVATGDKLSVKLRSTDFARVHVIATRYVPEYDAFSNLARVRDAELRAMLRPAVKSSYVEGRNIGDEYRYILDRKFARKYPGVMLDRPQVLLNPWAVRSTQTEKQVAQEGGNFAPAAPPAASPTLDPSAAPESAQAIELPIQANLDFLGQPAVVLSNLVPDDNGVVEIPLAKFGPHHLIQIVAVDPIATAYHAVALPEQKMQFADLRLLDGLDVKKHFTQQKKVTVIAAGQTFQLDDILTSKFETYDNLARVYRLYSTLTQDPKLTEFGFVLNWPGMKPEEKQKQYSKYACHELNFFLFKKDPDFFNAVVKPYLANKRDKTFLDRWLLGLPLDPDLEPWSYERLNVAERILLSQRIASDKQHGQQHIRDLFDLVPPDIERANLLFRTALRGSALEARTEGGTQLGLIVADVQERFAKERLDNVDHLHAFGAAGGVAGRSAGVPATPKPAAEPADRDGNVELEARDAPARGLRRKQMESGKKLDAYFGDESLGRTVRQLFEQIDKTQEWAENNYYKLPIENQNAQLITVNTFWRDYANHDAAANKPFLSANFADASHNFTEMMLALALLDLPFEPAKQEPTFEKTKLTVKAGTPFIAFHEEIRESGKKAEQTAILLSQNYFNAHDRYQFENNERVDKFVTDEFLVHTAYGCQVVVTNPTSSAQKLDVLLQIPVGAIAISGGEATRSLHIQLAAFSTQTIEYFFYFPAPGKYPHYPVHVSKNEELLAYAEPTTTNVVEELTSVDRKSWEYISQYGSEEQVLDYLRTSNLHRIDLAKIAFRLSDKTFFQTVIGILTQRHAYNHVLWSYGIRHNAVPAIREFLRHSTEFVDQVGDYLDSTLLTINPIQNKTYQHLEYSPLVNARAHQLSRNRQILNDRFLEQYHRFLNVLSYKRQLTSDDRLEVTYYLLLQDRVAEASEVFQQVNADQLATRLQYDYFAAYLSLLHEDIESAEEISTRYANHPVDRWRNAFAVIAKQIDESQGAATEVIDSENRNQVQGQLAATEPSVELLVESQKVTLRYQNLNRVTVNYYLMDIELLFSRNPFVQTQSGQFASIRPNVTQTIDLPAGKANLSFPLPDKLQQSNLLVEVVAAGQTTSQPYYANSLAVQVQENYGQVRAVAADSGKPLSKVYVKAYARMKDGSVRFYKDGYTDLRGRFEYASLNTNDLDHVDRFSLLVLSDDHGATVREASPPKQ